MENYLFSVYGLHMPLYDKEMSYVKMEKILKNKTYVSNFNANAVHDDM